MLRLLHRRSNGHFVSTLARSCFPPADQWLGMCTQDVLSSLPHQPSHLHHEQHALKRHFNAITHARRYTHSVLPFAKWLTLCSPALAHQEPHQNYQKQHQRGAHTEGIYVHHTTGFAGHNSMAVTIGLFHALQSSRPSLGFFTPIEVTASANSPSRFQIMKDVFKLSDADESMRGITHMRAFELIEHDKMDELLEEVLKAYEAYKARYDFVFVEGASLKRAGDDSTVLNARIASTLGLPVLMVTNARKAASVGETRIVRWDKLEWEQDIALSMQLIASVMKRNFVDVLGSVIHRLPDTKRGETLLQKHFQELKIPYFGAMPEDSILKRIKVDDIVAALGADILYGTHGAIARSKDSSRFISAMPQLSDVLSHIKGLKDGGESIVVITDAVRSDILLGLIAVHQSDLYPNISAIILAGASMLPPEVEVLVKENRVEELPPIIYTPDSSFETAATLADLEGQILPESSQKIEHSKVLFDRHIDKDHINELLAQDRTVPIHPKVFQNNIFNRAKKSMQHIVLPEGDEPRTVQAAAILLKHGVCNLTMLGDHKKIEELAKEFHVDLSGARLVDPSQSDNLTKYSEVLYEARKHKGMTDDEARKKVLEDVNYFGTCMVALGDADGMVSGAVHTTADTVRPALQIIKTEPGLKIASSVFFMCLQGKVLVFGDCAINADPTSEELSLIAIASANTAAAFGIEPRVALLSYATGDSNSGPLIQKVSDAATLAKRKKPDLLIDGPLQYDAAVNPETAKIKLKGKSSPVAGKATVFIFPDLNTGNTTYKAVQQSTGALAMGPVIQGLRKPVNDLSRGCTVHDIVSTVAITAVQAASVRQKKTTGPITTKDGA